MRVIWIGAVRFKGSAERACYIIPGDDPSGEENYGIRVSVDTDRTQFFRDLSEMFDYGDAEEWSSERLESEVCATLDNIGAEWALECREI